MFAAGVRCCVPHVYGFGRSDEANGLSFCPLLKGAKEGLSEAIWAFAALSETFTLQSVSAVASATRDVLQRLLVPNFDA